MKQYMINYFESIGEPPHHNLKCEIEGCGNRANDIHHIDARGMGGSKLKDNPENLIAVCRGCHDKYGDRKQHKEMLRDLVQKRIKRIGDLHGKGFFSIQ